MKTIHKRKRASSLTCLVLGFFILSFSQPGFAATLVVNKPDISPNEAIPMSAEGLSGDRDWVGIYNKGDSNDWANVLSWGWISSQALSLAGVPGVGEYEARLFFHNSYVMQARSTFNVSEASINTSKNSYQSNESIHLSVAGLSGDRDWVGIYQAGDSNAWHNVLSWGWANDNTLDLQGIADAGEYEARLFFHNSFQTIASTSLSVVSDNNIVFGARAVPSTPLSKGKLFAAPNGSGNLCSMAQPCEIKKGFSALNPEKNVLFLRGGEYIVNETLVVRTSGTPEKPVIIESYPGETAVLTANATYAQVASQQPMARKAIYIGGETHQYIHIRKLEITRMGGKGIFILRSSHNKVEGCVVHDNYHTGIHIYGDRNSPADDNVITDTVTYNNSDVGLNFTAGGLTYDNGGNADGISVSSGADNEVLHNTAYNNSDDGIDVWGTTNAFIAFNSMSENGADVNLPGNGNGLKACSYHGSGARIEHNIAYDNKEHGFDCHRDRGTGVTFKYNTAYNNGRLGFGIGATTNALLENNIASLNQNNRNDNQYGIQRGNSWQIGGSVVFINTDPTMRDFLRPARGSVFERIGAYSHF